MVVGGEDGCRSREEEVEEGLCKTHVDGQSEDDVGENEHSSRTEDAGPTDSMGLDLGSSFSRS